MWQRIDPSIFGEMRPHEEYLYYDGPRIYSVLHNGRYFYVHQCDEEREYMSYFVREATAEELDRLKNNEIPLRDFIWDARPLYLVKLYNDPTPHPAGNGAIEAFIVNAHDFAEDHFPVPGTRLTRD